MGNAEDVARKLIEQQIALRAKAARAVVAASIGKLVAEMLLRGETVSLDSLEAEVKKQFDLADGDRPIEESLMSAVALLKEGCDPTKPGALT